MVFSPLMCLESELNGKITGVSTRISLKLQGVKYVAGV